MGVAIFIRCNREINHFRNTILSTILNPEIDKIILCYPYIYEYKPYSYNGEQRYGNYSVLEDELQRAILSRDYFEFETISINTNDEWRESYEKFVRNLKINILKSRKEIKFNPYFFRGNNNSILHSKVMIGYKSGEAVIMMVGSSNLTNKAFGIMSNDTFNHETDVVLWDENRYKFSNLIYYNSQNQFNPIVVSNENGRNVLNIINYFDLTFHSSLAADYLMY